MSGKSSRRKRKAATESKKQGRRVAEAAAASRKQILLTAEADAEATAASRRKSLLIADAEAAAMSRKQKQSLSIAEADATAAAFVGSGMDSVTDELDHVVGAALGRYFDDEPETYWDMLNCTVAEVSAIACSRAALLFCNCRATEMIQAAVATFAALSPPYINIHYEDQSVKYADFLSDRIFDKVLTAGEGCDANEEIALVTALAVTSAVHVYCVGFREGVIDREIREDGC